MAWRAIHLLRGSLSSPPRGTKNKLLPTSTSVCLWLTTRPRLRCSKKEGYVGLNTQINLLRGVFDWKPKFSYRASSSWCYNFDSWYLWNGSLPHTPSIKCKRHGDDFVFWSNMRDKICDSKLEEEVGMWRTHTGHWPLLRSQKVSQVEHDGDVGHPSFYGLLWQWPKGATQSFSLSSVFYYSHFHYLTGAGVCTQDL